MGFFVITTVLQLSQFVSEIMR